MLYDDKQMSRTKFNTARTTILSKTVSKSMIDKWMGILGDPVSVNYLVKYAVAGIDDSKATRVFNFTKRMFLRRGYTVEEAIEYLNSNYRLFSVDVDRIASMLSVADLSGLGDRLFFEHPEVIYGACDANSLYLATKFQCKKEPNLSELIDTAKSIPAQKEKALSKGKEKFFSSMYMRNLCKENETQRELK